MAAGFRGLMEVTGVWLAPGTAVVIPPPVGRTRATDSITRSHVVEAMTRTRTVEGSSRVRVTRTYENEE